MSYRLALFLFMACLVNLFLAAAGVDENRQPSQPAAKPGDQPAGSLGACSPWVQVNQDAFGLPAGALPQPNDPTAEPFAGEEGFETVVFKNQLYLGMEADNNLGARLWRTRPGVENPGTQADWEEVAATSDGSPFGEADRAVNDHIDSLAVFNGYIYASTANRSGDASGFHLYRNRSGNRDTWEEITEPDSPGFRDPNNENFKDMQVFTGAICGGTWNSVSGAEVWCSRDGVRWSQTNPDGFGRARNRVIWSGGVFGGRLYFGVQNIGKDENNSGDDTARLFATQDPFGGAWDEVFTGEAGSYRAMILGEYERNIYISVMSREGVKIYRSSNGEPGSWTAANIPGMAKDAGGLLTVVDGSVMYQDALYLGVTLQRGGWQLWRLSGDTWENVTPLNGSDPRQRYAVLAVFHDHLYAWVTNYSTGQQALATGCSICETIHPSGQGAYRAFGGRVSIVFDQAVPAMLEVCSIALPGQDHPVEFDVSIKTNPVGGIAPAKLLFQEPQAGGRFIAVDGFFDRRLVCDSLDAEPALNTVSCVIPDSVTGRWKIRQIGKPAIPDAGWSERGVWLGLFLVLAMAMVTRPVTRQADKV